MAQIPTIGIQCILGRATFDRQHFQEIIDVFF
jgi:hypothetical protein